MCKKGKRKAIEWSKKTTSVVKINDKLFKGRRKQKKNVPNLKVHIPPESIVQGVSKNFYVCLFDQCLLL